ncbi:MAG: DUF2203 domain-containing protein [Chloroflexi bacterium]|nr:DUF2203 domain-containing protein [Chloroflexota bacterium]
MATRYFTVEEANSLLSWLRGVLEATGPLRHEISSLEEQMVSLVRQGRTNGSTGIEGELSQKRQALDALSKEMNRHVEAIAARGIVVRDVGKGLVDFPSVQGGREVHLCWLLGEAEISYWHETNAGFAGRQPL